MVTSSDLRWLGIDENALRGSAKPTRRRPPQKFAPDHLRLSLAGPSTGRPTNMPDGSNRSRHRGSHARGRAQYRIVKLLLCCKQEDCHTKAAIPSGARSQSHALGPSSVSSAATCCEHSRVRTKRRKVSFMGRKRGIFA